MNTFLLVLTILSTAFSLIYFYQVILMILGIFCKDKKFPKAKVFHSFAVIISARNEQAVIGDLIQSIKSQNYPNELIKVFVVADNCTDQTAEICRASGVNVFERNDKSQIGKGFALKFLFKKISDIFPDYCPDAIMFFDADNILSPDYVLNMNNALDSGVDICTSFRNSKNYSDNWISAGSSYSFIRECRFYHKALQKVNISTTVSGTGFYISNKVLKFSDGWNYTSIVEDTEFSIQKIIEGKKVGYCSDAIFFDEQPVKFKQAWRQRLRWAKGQYICLRKYQKPLTSKLAKGNIINSIQVYLTRCFPVTLIYIAFFILTLILSAINLNLALKQQTTTIGIVFALFPFIYSIFSLYLSILFDSLLVTILDWNKIVSPSHKKLLYAFTTPFFIILVSFPVSVISLFTKVTWKPIEHTKSIKNIQKNL